jgi:hypothetical protein
MNRPELFVKSVDTLVDAYEKGNLKHLSACNCAVGNLIAYNTGTYNFHNKTGGQGQDWVALVDAIRERVLLNVTKNDVEDHKNFVSPENGPSYFHLDIAYTQMYLTGYTPNEVERIEAAFEKNDVREEYKIGYTKRKSAREEDAIDGLLKAVEVLGEIHDIPEETVHCMKEKIQNKTYVKSFELTTPDDSMFGTCSNPGQEPQQQSGWNEEAILAAVNSVGLTRQ